MPPLLERLAQELERPRAVSEQVVKHLTGTYEIRREDLGAFLVNELPKLEEYEVDLALAPLFTPTLLDQAVFASLLGAESLPPAQWPALIQQLATRPTVAQLVTSDGQTHRVNLCEVTIERFVHRLRLDGAVSSEVTALVAAAPTADQPMLLAIARRAVWENAARRDILVRFLNAGSSAPAGLVADATELLKLAETYQPANLAELLAQIPHWQNMLREEINSAAGAKPFFNERVEELHGGGRDQRRQDNSRLAAKQAEFEFLQRLQVLLGGEPG